MLDIWALYFAKTVAVEVPLVALLAGNREPRRKGTVPAAVAAEGVPVFWPPRWSWRWRLRAAVVTFLANLVSHPLLTGAIWYWVPTAHGSLAELQTLLVLEVGVIGLEALILWLVLRLRLWHAVGLSLLINGITMSMSPVIQDAVRAVWVMS